jgi:hypothetical protein
MLGGIGHEARHKLAAAVAKEGAKTPAAAVSQTGSELLKHHDAVAELLLPLTHAREGAAFKDAQANAQSPKLVPASR